MVNIDQSTLDMLNAGREPTHKKKNKFNAVKEKTGGETYHSKKEAERSRELYTMEKCGIISDLETQVEYILQDEYKYNGKIENKISYFADFEYKRDGKIYTEDVKGFKTNVYKLKRKMLLSRYPDINFIET